MPKRKGKTVSFDAMVKFFMHNYEIPTKKDVDKLNARLDRIEKLVRSIHAGNANIRLSGRSTGKLSRGRSGMTAFDQVLQVIQSYSQGTSIADIKLRTGFDDKKIRNIIFRLHKNGKIKRKSRGVYVAR